MRLFRVLVFGGRNWSDARSVYRMLDQAQDDHGPLLVISGGATGADTHAIDWAEMRGARLMVFRAEWKRHGLDAGPLRNQRMLDEGIPDLGIQFPGHEGTADMLERLHLKGVPVIGYGQQEKLL